MADSTVTRPADIEEVTNRHFIHPLSRIAVKHFARRRVHPNAVSLMGMALGAGAAAAYFHFDYWFMSVAGFLLMIGWHVMDGADGQLARLTGQTSQFGRVLDGLCDHLTFALVYLSFAVALTPELGLWIWLVALAAGLSHIVQAGLYEYQRLSYQYWVHRRGALSLIVPQPYPNGEPPGNGLTRLFYGLGRFYTGLQLRLAGGSASLHRMLHEMDAAELTRFRRRYRKLNLRAVRRWNFLSSNYRTLAIFVAALAGSPVYYFAFEIVVLNVALVLLLLMQRRNGKRLHRKLAERMTAAEAPALRHRVRLNA